MHLADVSHSHPPAHQHEHPRLKHEDPGQRQSGGADRHQRQKRTEEVARGEQRRHPHQNRSDGQTGQKGDDDRPRGGAGGQNEVASQRRK